MYSWDYTTNNNESEDENQNTSHRYDIIDLDPVMNTNTVNIKSVSQWWCSYALSNT